MLDTRWSDWSAHAYGAFRELTARWEMMRGILESGSETMPAVGNDIADPDQTELAYDATPIRCLLSLCDADDEIAANLDKIACPVLIMTSPQDHVVPPQSS